ncbi:MAG: RNA polymerase sigma-70 factor [Ignavibacteria bacterium]|jgi:RNA polymerase sigma-70 factor (ECF subfamily)|nr:RNA polymerase sigma-70 factor [Ignavibacteria bacterium]
MYKVDDKKLAELITGIKGKNHEAFREFFMIFQPGIFHYLIRLTCDKSLAQDLTQETFLKFWICSEKIDINSSPKAYLYKIARNLALNSIRQKHSTISYDEDESLLIYFSRRSEAEIDSLFFVDDYQKAVNSLPERCKTVFLLSRFNGFDYSEIAETMEISLQTVKNQMNKALSVLRKRLQSHLN